MVASTRLQCASPAPLSSAVTSKPASRIARPSSRECCGAAARSAPTADASIWRSLGAKRQSSIKRPQQHRQQSAREAAPRCGPCCAAGVPSIRGEAIEYRAENARRINHRRSATNGINIAQQRRRQARHSRGSWCAWQAPERRREPICEMHGVAVKRRTRASAASVCRTSTLVIASTYQHWRSLTRRGAAPPLSIGDQWEARGRIGASAQR